MHEIVQESNTHSPYRLIRSNQIKSISQPKSYNSNLPIAGVDLIISKFVLLYLISSVTINNNDRQAI